MKKIIGVTLSLCIIGLLGYLTLRSIHKTEKELPLITISQIVEHTSLDKERAGILEALKQEGFEDGKNIRIAFQNAQGNMAASVQIANQQLSQKPQVMVAISTPSAQNTVMIAQKNSIPVVFTAVSNPVSARLVDDLRNPPIGVAGVSDALSIESQIQLIKHFLPSLKTIGVIYNAGESNSFDTVMALKRYCDENHMNLIEATANKSSEVAAAANSLVGRTQVVYIPNDNTAVSAMSSIVQVAKINNILVFAGDEGSVKEGALATYGYDRLDLGKKAGRMVAKILKKQPVNPAIESEHQLKIYVNEDTLKNAGLTIPNQIQNNVIYIRNKK
jgi:putative ABC transport system substrate-binding protein